MIGFTSPMVSTPTAYQTQFMMIIVITIYHLKIHRLGSNTRLHVKELKSQSNVFQKTYGQTNTNGKTKRKLKGMPTQMSSSIDVLMRTIYKIKEGARKKICLIHHFHVLLFLHL